ncbi:hypothetical protein PI126_g20471 [Phytophthora idaei]|nr:hypothetical protein PI126_g20471 [Phytophthora idaei]
MSRVNASRLERESERRLARRVCVTACAVKERESVHWIVWRTGEVSVCVRERESERCERVSELVYAVRHV